MAPTSSAGFTWKKLIPLAQSSRPQIFMIGFFDANEAGLFRSSGKTVSLVSGHEIGQSGSGIRAHR